MAPKVLLVTVKVLSDSGSGCYSDVVEGIVEAVKAGMKILSMSLEAALGPMQLTSDEMYNMLISTAKDISPPGFDVFSGYGLVDAYAAVNAMLKIG